LENWRIGSHPPHESSGRDFPGQRTPRTFPGQKAPRTFHREIPKLKAEEIIKVLIN